MHADHNSAYIYSDNRFGFYILNGNGLGKRAVMLCQEKMNMVLQMPFNRFNVTTKTTFPAGIYDSQDIRLVIGEQTFEGIKYTSSLTVEPVDVFFNVPHCKFEAKGKDVLNSKKKNETPHPENWEWTTVKHKITNKVKRYTVKVEWKDVGKGAVKEYILSSLKADVREK